MRKSTIGLLVSVMIFAFAGLLYLQVNYIREIVSSQNQQFEDAVKRSLYEVSHNLELDEAMRIREDQDLKLKQQLLGMNNTLNENVIITQQYLSIRNAERLAADMDININEEINIQPGAGKSSLHSQTLYIQELLFGRYSDIENLINEAAAKQRLKMDERPIEERLDYKKLKNYIEAQLADNNIPLPFQYAVMDFNRENIFKSSDFEMANSKKVFSQILFPRDPASKLYTLKVVFPTKKKLVLSSINFIIPSIIFSFILLVVFTVTLYIILKQKHLSEMKKDFVSNMTHELKTPVSSISIAGQMLSDENLITTLEQAGSISKSASFNKITRTITDETKRLQFLIDKVLQMSLMEDGRSLLKIKKCDVNEILLNVTRIFDIQIEKCGGSLDLELEAIESSVYVDEMHFTNVLFNLMENAVKYRRTGVPLSLVAHTENIDDKIIISIRDNGTGIKKEYLKNVFERFYRVSTGNVHNVKGFGLGLAYVKKIVEELNGTIKVESEINVGTTFTISIPYIQ